MIKLISQVTWLHGPKCPLLFKKRKSSIQLCKINNAKYLIKSYQPVVKSINIKTQKGPWLYNYWVNILKQLLLRILRKYKQKVKLSQTAVNLYWNPPE